MGFVSFLRLVALQGHLPGVSVSTCLSKRKPERVHVRRVIDSLWDSGYTAL